MLVHSDLAAAILLFSFFLKKIVVHAMNFVSYLNFAAGAVGADATTTPTSRGWAASAWWR
jgi:hypothetical protein